MECLFISCFLDDGALCSNITTVVHPSHDRQHTVDETMAPPKSVAIIGRATFTR